LIIKGSATVSILFTIDATTVTLPVHPKFLRNPDPFRPALSEILIEKGDPLHPRYSISNAPDEIMLLKAAVKKRGRKGVETTFFRDLRCPGEPEAVAVPASILLTKGNLP
jgi:hypothetical protein